jgi:hypothetical protein
VYIYQQPTWPAFTWQHERLEPLLGAVRHQQGRVLGHMEALGFSLQAEALLQTLTLEALKSRESYCLPNKCAPRWRVAWALTWPASCLRSAE